jgi:hypothetical protein
MGADGVAGTGAVMRLAACGLLANYKNWNRGAALFQLDWFKSHDGTWCRLDKVEPDLLHGFGVFIIWKNGDAAKVTTVVYVGRGSLRDGLARCRRDPIFHHPDGLHVTWAEVSDFKMIDEIGAYLYQRLHPMWGDVVLSSTAMPVNLPISA